MHAKPLILVVEDDRPIRNFICVSLKAQGYDFIEAASGSAALAMIASHNPDLVILDLGLGDIDGLAVIGEVRKWSNVMIIVVSARDLDREKAEALDLGADDYLTKPFSATELMARIRVSFRHLELLKNAGIGEQKEFILDDLKIDYIKHLVFIKEKEIHLTPIEYDLIVLLSKHAGKVLTHNYILKEIWGSYTGKDTQSLRVFLANIRKKIENDPAQPKYILTEAGVGYRMVDEIQS
jgi:two-component system KDP operon response regulator KdpE